MGDPVHLWYDRWHWRTLSCRQTFICIFLLFLIPLSLLGVAFWQEASKQRQILQIAEDSLSHHQKLSLLLNEVIENEQLMQRFLMGDLSLENSINNLRKRIDEEMIYVEQSSNLFTQPETDEELSFTRVLLPIQQIIISWKTLLEAHESITQEINLTEHLKIVESIRACLKILHERIALTTQGDLITLLLDQLLYLNIPSLQQEMMRMTSLGQQMAYSREPSADLRFRFIGAMTLVNNQEEQIQFIGNRIMHLQQVLNIDITMQTILESAFSEWDNALREWLHEVKEAVKQDKLFSLSSFTLLSARAQGESNQLATSVTEQISRLVSEQVAAWKHKTLSNVALFSVIFLLILAMTCFLLSRILEDIKRMQAAARSMQKGNIHARLPMDVPTELSLLSGLFNDMALSIKELVASLQKMKTTCTDSLQTVGMLFEKQEQVLQEQTTASRRLFLHIKGLARAAETSQETMREALFNIQKTASSMKNGKESLQEFTYTLATLLLNGQSLANTLSLVNNYKEQSDNLISSMTQMTDRTNLLSLNAAIEAKKMGATSSGFGLIADEVRRLADQTAHTTLNIEQVVRQVIHSMATNNEDMQHLFSDLKAAAEQVKPFDAMFIALQTQNEQQLASFKKLQTHLQEEKPIHEALKETLFPIHQHTEQTAEMIRELHDECTKLSSNIETLQALLGPFMEHVH